MKIDEKLLSKLRHIMGEKIKSIEFYKTRGKHTYHWKPRWKKETLEPIKTFEEIMTIFQI